MNELFLKVVNASISAAWLILAILILRIVLKKAPKWMHVLLWGIAAMRLLLPFSVESTWSLLPSAETIPMNIEMDTTPAIDSGIYVIDRVVNPMISQSNTPAVGASANPLQVTVALFAYIWALGVAALLIYTVVSYWRLHSKVNTAVLYCDNIYQSEHVSSPFVLGIIRPKIYLPFQMDGKELEHVVAHEKAHIRRKDHWWKPVGFLMLTVHWFNPLIWLAYVLLCRDIELACDEKVIRKLGNAQRADYTQALLACSVNRRTIAACPLAFGEVGVQERVKSVANYKKPAFWIVMVSVIACAVVAVCFLTNPKRDSYDIKIVVPAGSQERIVYSHEDISPTKNQIIITSGDHLGDTEVVLKPIEGRQERAYDEPAYLTPGMPVKMDVEKGAWFKVGISMQNPTDEDIVVYVHIKNIQVRIADNVLDDLHAANEEIQESGQECYDKAIAQFEQVGDLELRIAELIDTICLSPETSSNPRDYIAEHDAEYRELIDYGTYTLRYCFAQFLEGGQTGLKGHIMRLVLDELAPDVQLGLEARTGQEYFDEWKAYARQTAEQHDAEWVQKYQPAIWILLQMMNE